MAATPRNEADMRACLQSYIDNGNSYSAGARAIDMNVMTFKRHVQDAIAKGFHLSNGAFGAVSGANLSGNEARAGWIVKVDKETGARESTYWRALETEPSLEDVAQTIRATFEGIKPAKAVIAPQAVLDDLCTVYPLMDMHLGMRAWSRETGGQDYDLSLACRDVRHAFAKVLTLVPASQEAVLILGGDTLHADDDNAETPQSKHKLDVDGRQFKVIETAIEVLAETIDRLAAKHSCVTIRVLRGNHDMHSHLVLTFALHERYRNEPRVTIDRDPRDLFMKQWGKSAIFAHHGDRGKPDRMALYISDICPFWSETRHRHYLVGHVHHDNAKDIGPLRYESLRAFCPPDAYAAGMGYGARRALQALTFHRNDGLVLRALDPIDRLPETV